MAPSLFYGLAVHAAGLGKGRRRARQKVSASIV